MPNEIPIKWDANPTDFTVTNLATLANGNLWQSAVIDDSDTAHSFIRISFELIWSAAISVGDRFQFWILNGDEAASNEIWPGGVGTSGPAQITAAASIAAVKAIPPSWGVGMITSHGTTVKGSFTVEAQGPSWQLVLGPEGGAVSSGTQRLRYRYGVYEVQ